MKNQYKRLFMVVLLLTGRMAVGQDTGPSGPVGSGVRTGSKPFVGVGISIPLQKLFGHKKVKALPVLDKQRAMGLPDSAILPVAVTDQIVALPLPTDSSVTLVKKPVSSVSAGRAWVNNEGPEETVEPSDPPASPPIRVIDLPIVVVTAPAPGGGGGPVAPPGPGPAFVPPSVGFPGSSGGGDGGGTIETDDPSEPPCRGMLRRAQRASELRKQSAALTLIGAFGVCGYTGVKVAFSAAVADAWLFAFPGVGEVALGSIVAGTGIIVGGACLAGSIWHFYSEVASAERLLAELCQD